MPIHDWTRVPSGLFHEFHQSWTVRIKDALNAGAMPKGYYAFVEQRVGGPEPDVIAIETGRKRKINPNAEPGAGTPVLDPPRARLIQEIDSDSAAYARKANRITVRHQLGEVIGVIEIVSPGNKDSRNSFRAFVEKAVEFLRAGVHLLIVDLFPPTARDPQGIHKAIADEFQDAPFELPSDKPLTLVGYRAAPPLTAYIEPVAVGDVLPDMPLFLTPDLHVPVPLESTYQATWAVCPEPIRELVEVAK
jgi:hypothetical protein